VQGIEVNWTSEDIRFYQDGTLVPPPEVMPPSGKAKKQWTVTVSKQLGPHKFEESLTIQQLGVPPVRICRDYELRAVRKLEQVIMWHRELAEEGMAEG
jgi:hypothetical protein